MELAPPDTLIVRRLPEALTEGDLNELFQHFGAQSAKRQYLRGKKRRSNVLVKFPTHEDATLALIRLHQLAVMDKRLVVEYANFTFLPPPKFSTQKITEESIGEGPWEYKAADQGIVNVIASHLLRNETFYRRVLQLMKQMGINSPFSEQQPVETPVQATSEIICESPIEEVEMEELYKEETEESELESDSEARSRAEAAPELPKRQKKLKLKRLDRLKAIKVTKVATQAKKETSRSISDVFEQPKQIPTEKKFQLKITTEAPSIEPIADASTEIVEGFGVFKPVITAEKIGESADEQAVSTCTKDDFITEQTLQINRLTEEEKKNSPVFRSYSPGVPNSRLYIKNIAKTVKDEDLKFVFGRYVNWESEEERNMFDIRLMTEGRMKGQAFITLPGVEQAQKALAETNGFVLQGKPFVVQFARAATSKQNTT